MITLKEIIETIESSNHDFPCFMIDEYGRDHPICKHQVAYYVAERTRTVKIEDLENYIPGLNISANTTVHCFISPARAKSFDVHEDLCDVTIYCIDGMKTIEVDGIERILQKNEQLFIPKGTPHKATNLYDSVILSIGE